MARDGIRVDQSWQRELGEEKSERSIDQFPSTAAIFFPEENRGRRIDTGAEDLAGDASSGSRSLGHACFYEGETAKRIVRVRAAGGILAFPRSARLPARLALAGESVVPRIRDLHDGTSIAGGFIVGSVPTSFPF